MGRKKTRQSRKSSGSMNSISKHTKRIMRAENKQDMMRVMLNKLDAWKKGKNVILHEEGTNTREGMVRKKATDVWGNPNRKFRM
tara:strand:- start:478 stop:729 length:252 start_codon:yes stop_codon:yes gene_type:complete